jgi:glycosyltransferase involved in cell wall biosynthesis
MIDLIRQTQVEGAFDVAHVEHLRGAAFSQAVAGLPIVFDSVDSITLLFEEVRRSGPSWRSRLLARLDLTRTRHYEGRLLNDYQRVLVTSPRDKETLLQLTTTPDAEAHLVVLPNGVDLDYFKPQEISREPATLVFTGKMSYHANVAAAVDLANQVMPLVWQRLPEAKLVMAGKDPPAELVALAADPRLTVTGTVPDLRPYLAQASVAVAPMRYGVGIQNKVLEAMAMATPVITTPQTVTALQTRIEQDILVADTPQAMAQLVVNVLTNDALRHRVGQAGRQYVETHHDWQVIAAKLARVYREVLP